jgi:hypothetical protein
MALARLALSTVSMVSLYRERRRRASLLSTPTIFRKAEPA